MESKSTDWRPGNTVCRCCLTEGCYKDISTEYFWMGKREVYSEMLTETFDLNIAFSKSGGPNSNSRLICEPCISRLRDASDFKRQVQECERTFMQFLDPGSSGVMTEVELDKEVKIEAVKLEEASDEDLFDDRDFGTMDDDDDDDLDDQPLTKLASKIPKKESVDIMELLDSAKVGDKRKASTKLKVSPTKKVSSRIIKITGKEVKVKNKKLLVKATTSSKEPKATVSKLTVKPEKKKKGSKRNEPDEMMCKVDIDTQNVTHTERESGVERRTTFRNNIAHIIRSTTACPFKYRKGIYLCYFCKETFLEPEKLREHNLKMHLNIDHLFKPRKYEPVKMDFAETTCKLCGIGIMDYPNLKAHLLVHGKVIDDSQGDCVLPYKLCKDDYCCQICGKRYEMFLTMHKHMNDHFEHYICETCGKRFATSQRMVNHSRTHERGDFPCKTCDEIFSTYSTLNAHVAKAHRSNKRYKCPICDEKFISYKHRVNHLKLVHGKKTALFPCPSCPKVFDLCSRRTAHIKFQHLQERNHVCAICGMKFFTNYELQEHSVKHGGERIYHCDVCKKSYARMKTLREHMRIHNNDRRFVCPVCGQTFIQNCSLKSHMRVHHPLQMSAKIQFRS